MLRDLRYEEIEQIERRRSRLKLALFVIVVSAVATVVVARERSIHQEWKSLPAAAEGDLESLEARRTAIEGLLDRRRFWVGAFQATRELDELVVAIHNEERLIQRAADKALRAKRRQLEEAEAARVRGLRHVERGEHGAALSEFRRAIELTDDSWEHRNQVLVDVEALEKWSEGGE